MKYKNIFCLLFSSAFFANTHAQENTEIKKGFKYNNNFDLSLAANSDQFVGALSWVHFIPIGKNKNSKLDME
jgi:hypothetical protein